MTTFSELIGTALLHFIWQGTLIALLLALVLVLLKKATPQVRYSISWIALLVMMVLPVQSVITAYQALHPVDLKVEQATATVAGAEQARKVTQAPDDAEVTTGDQEKGAGTVATPPPPEKMSIMHMLYTAKPYLAAFWGIGVIVMTLRLFGGWLVVSRLKKRNSEPVAEALEALFERLKEQAGIGGDVILRQTKACTNVLLIGWIKPAVLLPMSVVAGMSTDHIEAIIAHELAHIKRYDYILAGVQAVIETLLFFHPAVWWVSRQIRIEREHCCDDLAVAIINDRARYARALYELESKRNHFMRFALSANDGSLLSRITRLATAAPAKRQNAYMRTGLSSMVIVLVVGMSLLMGSCTDLSRDTENPVSVGLEFDIPSALASMIAVDDWEGAIEYLHRVRNEGNIDEALEMTLGAYAKADESLRVKLMYVLAHIDSPEADDALVQIAETDPSMNVRRGAIRSINIRIVEDPEVGNETVRPVGEPPGPVYKYPAMTLRRERALTSALQHIAQDNEQGNGVRSEALRALIHRDDLSGFFDDIITNSTDDWFTLATISELGKQDRYIPGMMAIYRNNTDYGVRGLALIQLGYAGALEAFPYMFESLLEGKEGYNIEDMRDLTRGVRLSWNARSAIRILNDNVGPGEQDAIRSEVIMGVTDFLDRAEVEADRGFASEQTKQERLQQTYILYGLVLNFSRNTLRSAELERLAERTKRFGEQLETNKPWPDR